MNVGQEVYWIADMQKDRGYDHAHSYYTVKTCQVVSSDDRMACIVTDGEIGFIHTKKIFTDFEEAMKYADKCQMAYSTGLWQTGDADLVVKVGP